MNDLTDKTMTAQTDAEAMPDVTVFDDLLSFTERRKLEILVARARGWTVEPYAAQIPNREKGELETFDCWLLKDETGEIRSEWMMEGPSAWLAVPKWTTDAAALSELECHICERFGSIDIQMIGKRKNGAVCCIIMRKRISIGGYYPNSELTVSGTCHSIEQKGVAVCRAYLQAVAAV